MSITNSATVNYDYIINGTSQQGTELSNEVESVVFPPLVSFVKQSNKTAITEGETALQTVTITNNSPAVLTAINFVDTMTNGASFVDGTVTINGTTDTSLNPMNGFALDDIDVGDSLVITYQIQPNSPIENQSVTNKAKINYTVNDPTAGNVSFSNTTNEVTIDLAVISVEVKKYVNKTYVNTGDKLLYTINVRNTGNTDTTNLTFVDEIPDGTTFVEGSVTINGVVQASFNPETGFALPDLAVNDTVTITFNVTVM